MKTLVSRIAVGAGMVAVLLVAALPVAAADSKAMVRVLHASPDAPAVDIYINDAIVDGWTNVPFGTLSDYMAVPADTYNVKIYATGDTTSPVIDTDVTVDAGKSYTIAASGLLADNSLKAYPFVDEPNLQQDKALVRVVHLSPDAPAVDVAPDGGDALITNLEFPNATDYAALAPGSFDLEVRLAGTMTVALDLDPITLDAGKAYSVFAIGSAAQPPAGGNALQVVAALDDQLLPNTDTTTDGTASGNPLALAAALGAGLFIGLVLIRARRSAVRA
jgi:uncharacterized protein DUF4397